MKTFVLTFILFAFNLCVFGQNSVSEKQFRFKKPAKMLDVTGTFLRNPNKYRSIINQADFGELFKEGDILMKVVKNEGQFNVDLLEKHGEMEFPINQSKDAKRLFAEFMISLEME